MKQTVVLVVDNSVLIIERWQIIFSEIENIKSVYGAVSYKDALRLFKEIEPNLVLLDGSLPGTMSVDLLKKFREISEKIIVIVLQNKMDSLMEEKFMSLGANFVFDKYRDFEMIPAVINGLADKKKDKRINEKSGKFYKYNPGPA